MARACLSFWLKSSDGMRRTRTAFPFDHVAFSNQVMARANNNAHSDYFSSSSEEFAALTKLKVDDAVPQRSLFCAKLSLAQKQISISEFNNHIFVTNS